MLFHVACKAGAGFGAKGASERAKRANWSVRGGEIATHLRVSDCQCVSLSFCVLVCVSRCRCLTMRFVSAACWLLAAAYLARRLPGGAAKIAAAARVLVSELASARLLLCVCLFMLPSLSLTSSAARLCALVGRQPAARLFARQSLSLTLSFYLTVYCARLHRRFVAAALFLRAVRRRRRRRPTDKRTDKPSVGQAADRRTAHTKWPLFS